MDKLETTEDFYLWVKRLLAENPSPHLRRYQLERLSMPEKVLDGDGRPLVETTADWNGQPRTQYVIHEVTYWRLIVAGTGSPHHSRRRIEIPAEVGEALAKGWKPGRWGGTYVGQRYPGGLLKLLEAGLPEARLAQLRAAASDAEANRAREQRNMVRQDAIFRLGQLTARLEKDKALNPLAPERLAQVMDQLVAIRQLFEEAIEEAPAA